MLKGNRRYYIGESNSVWPIKAIELGDGEALESYALLAAPPRSKSDCKQIENTLNQGTRLIGLSAYQNFPQRTVGPGKSDIEKEFYLWLALGGQIKGWLYGARNSELFLPKGLPRMLMDHSDFTNPSRIRPEKVDHTPLEQSKKYDFVYLCRENLWNEYCRNWHLGVRCVKKLARAAYKVAVVGHEDTRELVAGAYIDLMPTLHWYEWLAVLRRSRCLLVPNIYDASPRIIAEALCLDIPILVNTYIFGGWKYVNARTGRFFSSDGHIVEIAGELLCDHSLAPRKYFEHYYGPDKAGRALFKFIEYIEQHRN